MEKDRFSQFSPGLSQPKQLGLSSHGMITTSSRQKTHSHYNNRNSNFGQFDRPCIIVMGQNSS